MWLRVLILLFALAPVVSNAASGKLVRIDFTGEIIRTERHPFGKPHEHWKGKKVTGFFVYDTATRNALTPEQVKTKRDFFKEETTHMYLHSLSRPGFELTIPGHKIGGSKRPLVSIKYREMDTPTSLFIFRDGKSAYVEIDKQSRHGRMTVDGQVERNAEFELELFDKAHRLKSAELPARFPLKVGSNLTAYGKLIVKNRSISFRITKLSTR